ncbi:hypothetical protein KBD49_02320 [Myxococcota bacterium]|jgi:glutaredoxin|nr:hypothetical protein [Myxococcota bacterium]
MKARNLVVVSMALAIAAAGCKGQSGAPGQASGGAKEKVEFTMHVMSQCPFGVQVENAFKPVKDKLGDAVDLRIEFIGQEPSPGQLTSMHGDNEVKGNLLQICALNLDPAKGYDLILCMNKDMRAIPGNFDACAAEVKIDAAKVKACAEGDQGKKLLSDSFKRSQEKGARGSPTMFVAGQPYQGGRTEMDFMRAICAKYQTKPQACQNIPEPKKIPVTVLTDSRCKDCMPDRILGQLRGMFPGMEPKTLDYSTPEGKALYESLKDKGVKMLPAFLFAPVVAEDPGYQQVQRFMTDAGEYKLLQIGAKWDPTAEICDNGQDDDGNGQVDCQDDGCKGKIVCRQEQPKTLEVFVMSQCPFGVKALNAMKEVLEAFKDDGITFHVNFIADELPDGTFKALHGQPEVDENIRELCAIKLYPQVDKATGLPKYMQYILCRNQDIRSTDWQKCAVDGIDAKKMQDCIDKDGKRLHSENIKKAKELGIGASPTWLGNNKFQFSGIAAEQIKQQFCAYNKDLKGCGKTLSGQAQGGPSGGCGAN